jgi:hypothetical protein
LPPVSGPFDQFRNEVPSFGSIEGRERKQIECGNHQTVITEDAHGDIDSIRARESENGNPNPVLPGLDAETRKHSWLCAALNEPDVASFLPAQ